MDMEPILRDYFDIESSDQDRDLHKADLLSYFETHEEALFLSFIKYLDAYLTSVDDSIRGKATNLVANILESRAVALDPLKIHHLIMFFLGRSEDYPSLHASILGLKALFCQYKDEVDQSYGDAYMCLHKIFEEINVQSIAQSIRSEIYSFVTLLLGFNAIARSLATHQEEVINGVLLITNGERDPRCLVKSLHLLNQCLQTFPDSGPQFGEKIFDAAAGYFPITFRPAPDDKYKITTALLVSSVENCLCCHSSVAKYTVPLMVDKLASTDVSTDGKLDAMHCIVRLAGGIKSEVRLISILAKDVKIDYVLTVGVFRASLPRLSEILLDIITSNAAGDEGENDFNPTASKNKIVQAALDCVTAICALISNVRGVQEDIGLLLFQQVVEPILRSSCDALRPVQSHGISTLQLNSLTSISSTKILVSISRSSYWLFSVVLIRCSSVLIRDIDSSLSIAREALCSDSKGFPTPIVYNSTLQFMDALINSLGSSVNYSGVILNRMATIGSDKTSSYIIQRIFVSLLSRCQRTMCLFEERSGLLDSHWNLLSNYEALDLWMDTVPPEVEVGGSGCCKAGGNNSDEVSNTATPLGSCGDSLLLSEMKGQLCLFISSAVFCLRSLLKKCPMSLIPLECIDACSTIALDVLTGSCIHRPGTIADISISDSVTPSIELVALQDSCMSLLSDLFAINTSHTDNDSGSRTIANVVGDIIERMFGYLSDCGQRFSAVLNVLVSLSEVERRSIKMKADVIPLTKRLVGTLVGILSRNTPDDTIQLSCLKTILQLLCGNEVSLPVVPPRGSDEKSGYYEAFVDALNTNYYVSVTSSKVTLQNTHSTVLNASDYWLAPNVRYRPLNIEEETPKSAVEAAVGTRGAELELAECLSSYQSAEVSSLRLILRYVLSNPKSPGVGIVCEVLRLVCISLDTETRDNVCSVVLNDLLEVFPAKDSDIFLDEYLLIMRLANAAFSTLSLSSPVVKDIDATSEDSLSVRNVVHKFMDISFSIYNTLFPVSCEGTQVKCYEVSAWWIASVISKLPYKSNKLQDYLHISISTVRRMLIESSTDSQMQSAKSMIFGAVCLLVWTSRALFMRLDTSIRIPSSIPSSVPSGLSWQELCLENVLTVLLNGALSEKTELLCGQSSSRVHSRLPGGKSLHFTGASSNACYFLSSNFGAEAAVPAIDFSVPQDDSVDMDVIECDVVRTQLVDYLKYTLSLRMPVLCGETLRSGFVLYPYAKDSLHMSAVWKQKLFHRLFNPLSAAVLKRSESVSDSSDIPVLPVWALCGLLTGTPFTVLGDTETKLLVVKILVCAIGIGHTTIGCDSTILMKAKSAALVTLEEILKHENPPVMVTPFLSTVIPELLKVLKVNSEKNSSSNCVNGYSAADRARAARCLQLLLSLPYADLHGHKIAVLRGLRSALDDPKKAVRMLAVKIRNDWSVASGLKG